MQQKPDALLTKEILEEQFRLEWVPNVQGEMERWGFPPTPLNLTSLLLRLLQVLSDHASSQQIPLLLLHPGFTTKSITCRI